MSFENWKRARTFAWMASFLHFDKIFQIPIIVVLEHSDLSFTDIIHCFLNADEAKYPTISEMVKLFLEEAEKIDKGGAEYIYSEDWLGVYWPADEYMFIKLTVDKKIEDFYEEARTLLVDRVSGDKYYGSIRALEESIFINKSLISQPFKEHPIDIELQFNILEFGAPLKVVFLLLYETPNEINVARDQQYYQNLDDWCREVVWWGNKKGAYLYSTQLASNTEAVEQLAGHF